MSDTTATDSSSETQEVTESTNAAPETEEQVEHELDPKVREKLEKANREAANLRKRVRELEPKASAWDKAEAANKTELDKLKDDLVAKEVELNELRVDNVRRKAVLNAGLDPELAEFITAADDVEALEQAQKLAKRVGATPTSRRSPDMRQGARGGNPNAEISRDDVIRRMAGFGD